MQRRKTTCGTSEIALASLFAIANFHWRLLALVHELKHHFGDRVASARESFTAGTMTQMSSSKKLLRSSRLSSSTPRQNSRRILDDLV